MPESIARMKPHVNPNLPIPPIPVIMVNERAPVAQWIEHLTSDQTVGGSTPSRRANAVGPDRFKPRGSFFSPLACHPRR